MNLKIQKVLMGCILGLGLSGASLANSSFQAALSFENQTSFKTISFYVQNKLSGQYCMLNSVMPLAIKQEDRVVVRTQEPENCVKNVANVYFVTPEGQRIFCMQDANEDISWKHFRAVSDTRCEIE